MASVRRLPSGAWQVRYALAAGRGAQRRSRSFPTRGQARAFAATVEADLTRGRLPDPNAGRRTVTSYAATWYARAELRGLRPSTLEQYRHALDRDVLPVLGALPLVNVRAGHLDDLAAALTRRGLSPTTVRQRCLVAVMLLRAAARDGLIDRSPADTWRLPTARRRELAVLTPDEVTRLLEHAGTALPGVALGVGCGLRQGEMFGLRWERLDLLRRELHVVEQVDGAPLKTAAARRVVPMPQLVVDALAPVGRTEGPVLTSRTGRAYTRSGYNEGQWKPALRRAGLDPRLGMHALRHTYASLLIAAGQHPRIIQARLGHASITETMGTYGHLFPEAAGETRRALDAAFAGVGRTPGGHEDDAASR